MLKNLYAMKIDAKQELDNMKDNRDLERFKKAIIVPDGFDIDYLLEGDRYFITGNKGAGKTALLIYTALQAEELFNAERSFIIFKDISQEERDDFKKIAHITHYKQNIIEPYYDYEIVWRWLIHKNIVDMLLSSNKEIFIPDQAMENYINAVKVIDPEVGSTKPPSVAKDGYVELKLNIAVLKLNSRINLEFRDKTKKQIKFSTHVKEIDKLYGELSAGESQLYIIIDELNLSLKNSNEFERDIAMIRDLIIVIESMNMLSKQKHDNVRIISGIRNEVVSSIHSRGKEINKAIESYGVPIDWTSVEKDKIKHPLIKILINYLRISDYLSGDLAGLENDTRYEPEVYKKWISTNMFARPSEEILLSNSLNMPRNIVRLLNLAKIYCPTHQTFSEDTMIKIRKEYSKQCWNEIAEELCIIYTKIQIQAIKNLFAGLKDRTNHSALYSLAREEWKANDELQPLLSCFDDVLRRLYMCGIIGNVVRTERNHYRWYFSGDESLLLNQDIVVHRAFWDELGIISRRNI